MSTPRQRPLRCRVLLLHRWNTYRRPEGARFLVCTRCGKRQGPFFSPDDRPAYPIYPAVGG